MVFLQIKTMQKEIDAEKIADIQAELTAGGNAEDVGGVNSGIGNG